MTRRAGYPEPDHLGELGCLVTAALLIIASCVIAAPRSAATAIPAGNQMDLPSSGHLLLPSEAPPAAAGVFATAPGGASSSPSPAVVLSPPATPKPTTKPKPVQRSDGGAIAGGIATWCGPTPTQCQRWGGHALLGAVPSFRWGDKPYRVRVRYRGHHVDVTVVSFCACPRGRVIDLSPYAFRQLAPTWRGTIRVSVQELRR